MTRPSRGERWSATTTRQTGFFLLPTRVSLTRTAKLRSPLRNQSRAQAAPARAPTLAATGQLLQVRHLPRLHRAHHLLQLAELLDELVHGLDVGPRAERDPAPARAVEDAGIAALLGGHRCDDRLEPVEVAVVDLEVA